MGNRINNLDFIIQLEGKKIILLSYVLTEEFLANMLKGFLLERIYIINDSVDILMIFDREIEFINNEEWIFLIWFPEKTECSLVLLKYIIKNKIYNYMFISPDKHRFLYNRFFREYFINREVDISRDIIQIGNFVFQNFFTVSCGEVNLGDSILPSFFDDYSMINEGPFEYNEVSLAPGDVVFDCGANIGFFSAIALSKKCSVHAFEPTPETFECLRENLSRYSSAEYYLCKEGLYDKECMAEFFLYDYSEGNSMILDRGGSCKAYFPVTTIDKYVERNCIQGVDFIKVDIEGAERYMLAGAFDTIRRFRPKLSICTYHLIDDSEVIERMIKDIDDLYIT